MRVLRPGALLLDEKRLLFQPKITVQNQRIVEVESSPSLACAEEDFGTELWLAAPLFLHAHFEDFDAPSATWPRGSFAAWAGALLAWREGARLSPEESVQQSLQELAHNGCGLVLSSAAEGAAPARHPAGPEVLRFPEVFAPGSEHAGILADLDRTSPPGVALHAPWSVNPDLATAVFARFPQVSLHLGEHDEERELLRSGTGPLADLLRERGRSLPARSWDSPVDWLAAVGGLRPGTLAVHGGDLDIAELRRLQEAGVSLVWCPGTHEYFERPATSFGLSLTQAPFLGCDSRASNSVLDPLHEFRLACALETHWSPQAWWAALTRRAAAALGRSDLGTLEVGRRLRVLRLPLAFAHPSASTLLAHLASTPPPTSTQARLYEPEGEDSAPASDSRRPSRPQSA